MLPVLCIGNAQPETAPLMRGTLWWVADRQECPWTEADLRAAVEAQRAVGFHLLWLLNTPALLQAAEMAERTAAPRDVLAWLYQIAGDSGMKVIVDLPQGGWYGRTSADEMVAGIRAHVRRFHARYGGYPSFHGWYLNHEINPIDSKNTEETAFWRRVWQQVVQECHARAPGSIVTISPFFLLDASRRRGFVYQTPDEYAAWWRQTLQETGIDVLMLQDSGEHLAFFTLEQREPFWAAAARACKEAGAAFWLNIESGEANVKDWEEFLRQEQAGTVPWRFTPMPWLAEKLRLAAKYADNLVNWGYFPYMNPLPRCGKSQEADQDAAAAYAAYKAYVEGATKR
ncbi:MAG: DUF4434 domain-containing protein [Candidatus Hydrogenedentes bacterium]|nr:DUF4434 domain-containing protein [Candidatus Hydrogenedentota bacterium]